MTRTTVVIALVLFSVVLVVSLLGYFLLGKSNKNEITNLPTNEKVVEQVSDREAQVPDKAQAPVVGSITLSDLNQQSSTSETAVQLKFSAGKSGVAMAQTTSQLTFQPDSKAIFTTVLLPSESTYETVTLLLTAEKTQEKLGPIVARVKEENGTRYAVVSIKKSAKDWEQGSYKMEVFLPDGVVVAENFMVQ